MNSVQSKERIKYQTYKVERNKSEKEELINPQIDKSKRENITSDDVTPVYNYPYEFYDEEKVRNEKMNIKNNEEEKNKINKEEIIIPKKEEKKIEKESINTNININNKKEEKAKIEFKDIDKKILEQIEITKNLNQKIENVHENAKKDVELKNEQINKNEGAQNIEEKNIIKAEVMENKKIDNKINLKEPQKKEEKIKEIILKNVDKKTLINPPKPKEEFKAPKVKEIKYEKESNEAKKVPEKKISNSLHKSQFTQKTENDYNLMMKQLKNKDYKNNEEYVIKKLISSDDKIPSKENNIKPKRKEIINGFLQRNQDDIKYRQDNNKTINERLKIANENAKKRIYFDNKENEQKYFEEFYNNQIEFMNNCQSNLDKLTQQINEEKEKKYIPEPKNKTNLNYFKNKNSVELSKYKLDKKSKQENKKEIETEKNPTSKIKPKLTLTNPQNKNLKENGNKSKNSKNNDTQNKPTPKLTQKEIDELTNKLHYEGELLKVKKQTKISEEYANNPIYHNFSKDKLSRNSIIILIKKLLFEYSTSVKNNTYIDAIKNPKLNYEQYIEILKDLYYIEKDALPEEYLEDDTMYKELWDKLTKFSKGPENSLESNILLLYILELNGFFRNDKIIKELEPEIHWIKLDDYEELIANAKFIEENWDDLKMKKIENIKKLKSLGIYNPIHNEEIYNSNCINNNTNLFNSVNINSSNHYITIIKGNTNYELIHGYSTKKKNEDSDDFSEHSNDKKGKELYNSLTLNNNLYNKNKIPLQDGYNDILLQKRLNIENRKQEEEKKFREVYTFKPALTIMSKRMFNNNVKVDLPKHRLNKSVNITKSVNIQDNNQEKEIQKDTSIKLRKHKSNLQKMFKTNPLKNDKIFNERTQILKSVKSNEINDDNYLMTPMRFNIDYPSKFEGIGVSINRDSNLRQSYQNIIFYNIKVNDKIRTMKFVEGDDLKLKVINFVKKNKLPEEVVNIILNKIKEKELEEKRMNN